MGLQIVREAAMSSRVMVWGGDPAFWLLAPPPQQALRWKWGESPQMSCMVWGGEWTHVSHPGWSPDRWWDSRVCVRGLRWPHQVHCAQHSTGGTEWVLEGRDGHMDVMKSLSPSHGASSGPMCHRSSLEAIDEGQVGWVLHGLTNEDRGKAPRRPALIEGSLGKQGLSYCPLALATCELPGS